MIDWWLTNVYYAQYSYWAVTIISMLCSMTMYYIGRNQGKRLKKKEDNKPFSENYNI